MLGEDFGEGLGVKLRGLPRARNVGYRIWLEPVSIPLVCLLYLVRPLQLDEAKH